GETGGWNGRHAHRMADLRIPRTGGQARWTPAQMRAPRVSDNAVTPAAGRCSPVSPPYSRGTADPRNCLRPAFVSACFITAWAPGATGVRCGPAVRLPWQCARDIRTCPTPG